MKKILFFTLFYIGSCFGQSNGIYPILSGYIGQLSSKNILYVTQQATNQPNQFSTISSAISAWSYGKTIVIAPETFSENIIIPRKDSGIVIKGLSNTNTRIAGTFVDSAKNVVISDIRFDSSFSVVCQDTFSTAAINRFSDLVFAGDFYVGAKWSSQKYGAVFERCTFIGNDKTALFNQASGWENQLRFEGCSTTYWTADSSFRGINVKVYGGYNSFKNCPYITIDTLYYNCGITGGEIEGIDCGVFDIYGNIVADSNTVNYAVFDVTGGYVAMRNAVTFTNKFEFDLFHVEFAMPNLIFDNPANCRLNFVNQRIYGSTATISGTNLNTVFIKNSNFHFDAPAGLGENIGNNWKSFIDD